MSGGLPVPGVNVVGQFRSESGIGEAARSVVAALDAAGVPVLPVLPLEESPSRQGVDFAVAELRQATFPVTLSLLTAFETSPFLDAVPPHFLAGRRFVGLWWWELEELPDFMAAAFRRVDAVWAGSRHAERAFRRASGGVPVELVRYPVRRPAPATDDATSLRLPPGGPRFLVTFGYYSSVARKNPEGAIEAFRRAFPQPSADGPQLIVKTIDEDAHPAEHAALSELAGDRPDVHMLPGYLDRAQMDQLLAATDVVVSLHRAEGFGYTPAEAMALGVPAIATRWSGNLEYMHDDNALLVDARLVRIGERGGPYPPDGHWAEPDLDAAAEAMRRLAADEELRVRLGQRAAADLAAAFTPLAAGLSMLAALQRLPAAGRVPRRLALRRARWLAARLRAHR